MDPLETLRAFYAFYTSDPHDEEALARVVHPEVVILQDPAIPGTAGTFHGYAGLRQLTDEINESYDDVVWDIREEIPLGADRYLLLLNVSGRGTGSGIVLEVEIAHVVTLREGRLVRLETHLGWDNGRRAAIPSAAASRTEEETS